MDLGRASLPKYLALSLIGAVGGVLLIFLARGSGAERWLMIGCALILLALLGYVAWLLTVKNKSTHVASPAQKQAALQFAPSPGKGVIYLYRSQLVGLLVGLNVVLDGRPVGQTRGFRFYRLEVAPGTHVLSGDSKCPEPLEVTVGEGEIAYVEQEIVMGVVKGGYRYKRIADVPKAQQAIYGCKLLLGTS
jgi:uncharacterized protein DUF2846